MLQTSFVRPKEQQGLSAPEPLLRGVGLRSLLLAVLAAFFAEVNTAILELGQTCHLRPTGSDAIVLRVAWPRCRCICRWIFWSSVMCFVRRHRKTNMCTLSCSATCPTMIPMISVLFDIIVLFVMFQNAKS